MFDKDQRSKHVTLLTLYVQNKKVSIKKKSLNTLYLVEVFAGSQSICLSVGPLLPLDKLKSKGAFRENPLDLDFIERSISGQEKREVWRSPSLLPRPQQTL